MKKEKIIENLVAVAVFFLSFFNIFTIIFLIFSFVNLSQANSEKERWEHLEKNGVLVEAVITDIVTLPDLENHEVYFTYEYEEKEYTFMVYNYSEGRVPGKTIEAYIYPENPGELIIYDGDTSYFFFWFFLGLSVVSGIAGLTFILRRKGGGQNG